MLANLKAKWQQLPPWQRWAALAVPVAVCAYLAWCRFGSTPLVPGATVTATPVAAVADMERTAITPARVMTITDKAQAIKKLRLPASEGNNPAEQIQAAVNIPRTRNGATATVFLNTSSGNTRTLVQAKPAPWFALERGNAAGIAAEFSTGTSAMQYRAYYRRDIFQVKGVYFTGQVEATTRPEARVGIAAEYRW